jgi:cytochrome c oxidase assembly protein subunit 11
MARELSLQERRNRRTAFWAAGLVVGMVALSYASVPLYRIFCQVTGFGGTTQRSAAAPGTVSDRTVIVRFNADTAQGMPWSFQPVQRQVTVRLGEETLAFYRAHNPTSRPITGVATFNVTPDKAGAYFDKVACFCFNEQRLEPGQTVDMPVSFFVDPSIEADRNANDIVEITLSYTFFEKPAQQAGLPSAATAR